MKKIIFILLMALMPSMVLAGSFGNIDTSGHGVAALILYDAAYGTQLIPDSSGFLDSIRICVYESTGQSSQVRAGIWNYDNGDSSLIDTSAYVTVSATGWQIIKLNFVNGAEITQGNTYRIAVRADEDYMAICARAATGNENDTLRLKWWGSTWAGGAWPNPLPSASQFQDSTFIPMMIYYTTAEIVPQPDSLNWVEFDSLLNDFAADSDSVVVMIYAPAQTADSIKLRVTTGASYPSYSTGTLYQYDYPTAGDTILDTLIVVLTESGTLRARAWAYYDSASPDTSIHVQDSIYFSAGSSGTVDVGEIVEAFKSEGFVTKADSEYFKALFSGSISLPDTILQKIIYSGTDTNWISKADLDSIINYRIDSVMTAKWAQYGNRWRIIR